MRKGEREGGESARARAFSHHWKRFFPHHETMVRLAEKLSERMAPLLYCRGCSLSSLLLGEDAYSSGGKRLRVDYFDSAPLSLLVLLRVCVSQIEATRAAVPPSLYRNAGTR